MPQRSARLFGLLMFALLSFANGQSGSGVPVEVVSSRHYGKGSCGLVFCDEGVSYELRGPDTMYLLSCKRDAVWGRCPILMAGDKFTLTIDAKNRVFLQGSREGKPFDIQLDYEKSERLTSSAPANASQVEAQTHAIADQSKSRVVSAPVSGPGDSDSTLSPLSDSGSGFLAYCDKEGDDISKSACKIWVDAFMNGLMTGMAAATPGKAGFDPEKNDIICFSKTATYGQVFPLIVTYIRDHPAERNDPTAALAFSALQEAFPCKH